MARVPAPTSHAERSRVRSVRAASNSCRAALPLVTARLSPVGRRAWMASDCHVSWVQPSCGSKLMGVDVACSSSAAAPSPSTWPSSAQAAMPSAIGIGAAPRPAASQISAASMRPMPRPPRSSGARMVMKPISAAWLQRRALTAPLAARAACTTSSRSKKRRAASCIIACCSLSSRFMPFPSCSRPPAWPS